MVIFTAMPMLPARGRSASALLSVFMVIREINEAYRLSTSLDRHSSSANHRRTGRDRIAAASTARASRAGAVGSSLPRVRYERPGRIPDIGARAEVLDRAEGLAECIRNEGLVVQGRPHGALREELNARNLCSRLLARLGLDLEPLRSGPGHPPKGETRR
jgi:hypothetical protein